MAVLISDGIRFEISNIIGYNVTIKEYNETNEDYETFNLMITNNGQKVFNNIKHTKFEILSGNVNYLLSMLKDALDNKIEYATIDFEEPEFEFEIYRCKMNYIESTVGDLFELVIWFNCGQWNGIYGGTAIGCKMSINREELQAFVEELEEEYINRKIIPYDKKEEIE